MKEKNETVDNFPKEVERGKKTGGQKESRTKRSATFLSSRCSDPSRRSGYKRPVEERIEPTEGN
jgi:hypothetical protein